MHRLLMDSTVQTRRANPLSLAPQDGSLAGRLPIEQVPAPSGCVSTQTQRKTQIPADYRSRRGVGIASCFRVYADASSILHPPSAAVSLGPFQSINHPRVNVLQQRRAL
jgi:hypothetical protein